MLDETATQLQKAMEIFEEIRREYPEGTFDREMLHGEMDFRYKRIHELRGLLDRMPTPVRRFATFVQTLPLKKEEAARVMGWLLANPGYFSECGRGGFQAFHERAQAAAEALGMASSGVVQMLSRMRLAGILSPDYTVTDTYRRVVVAWVELHGSDQRQAS